MVPEIPLKINYLQIKQFSWELCARNFPALSPKNNGYSSALPIFKSAGKPLHLHQQGKTPFYLTTKNIFPSNIPVKLPNSSQVSFCNWQLLSSLVSEISRVTESQIQLRETEHWIFYFICQKDGIVWSLQFWLNENANSHWLSTFSVPAFSCQSAGL